MKGFLSSDNVNAKSPPGNTLESNPYLTIRTEPYLELTDSNSQRISSENPEIDVQEAATLIASEIKNCFGIVTLR